MSGPADGGLTWSSSGTLRSFCVLTSYSRESIAQDDEALKKVTVDWEGKKGPWRANALRLVLILIGEVEEATRRLAKSQDGHGLVERHEALQDELNQLNVTVRQAPESCTWHISSKVLSG